MKNLLKGALLVGAAVGIGLEIAKKLNKKEQEVKEETVEEMEKRHEKIEKILDAGQVVVDTVCIAAFATSLAVSANEVMNLPANVNMSKDDKDQVVIVMGIMGGLLGKATITILDKSIDTLMAKVRGDQDEC